MSKITVVTYCHEAHIPWIPHWLEQIQKQEFQDFKVLFVAHNWKASSLNGPHIQITQELGDRVKFVEYLSEPVIGAVIDHGCSLVDTEYFAHWDIDDLMHPSRLRLQHEFLEKHPDVDFLNARAVGFYGDEPEWPDLLHHAEEKNPLIAELTSPSLQSHDQIKTMFSRGFNCLAHGLMVYKPKVIETLGGFSRSDVKLDGKSPDFETWKKAMNAGYKFHRLPELLMYWRLDSSATRWQR